MSKPTFAERCQLAQQLLPDAQYRTMLTKLHAEMLQALAEQPAPVQQEPVATLYGSLPVYDKPAQQDIPDLIAGALGVSRGTAYDMMREALAEQPAQQEPDCWAVLTPNGSRLVSPDEAKGRKDAYALYTTPQAQPAREWVGLTVDELIDLEHKHLRHEDLVQAIEAKLKEKNT